MFTSSETWSLTISNFIRFLDKFLYSLDRQKISHQNKFFKTWKYTKFEPKHLKISQTTKKVQIQQNADLGDFGEFLVLFREVGVYDNLPKQF